MVAAGFVPLSLYRHSGRERYTKYTNKNLQSKLCVCTFVTYIYIFADSHRHTHTQSYSAVRLSQPDIPSTELCMLRPIALSKHFNAAAEGIYNIQDLTVQGLSHAHTQMHRQTHIKYISSHTLLQSVARNIKKNHKRVANIPNLYAAVRLCLCTLREAGNI